MTFHPPVLVGRKTYGIASSKPQERGQVTTSITCASCRAAQVFPRTNDAWTAPPGGLSMDMPEMGCPDDPRSRRHASSGD